MKTSEKYKLLDERLKQVMVDFYKEFPEPGVVSCTGSVLFGKFTVRRNGHPDGLTFKITDKQMDNLIKNKEILLKDEDVIHQEKYIDS